MLGSNNRQALPARIEFASSGAKPRTRAIIIFVFLSLLASARAFAETIDRRGLDLLFNNLAAQDLARGSIAIAQNGKIIYHRNVAIGSSQDPTYRIGSITKLFTAVLVYQAIDEKKLTLDDSLGKFFPDLPNADKIRIADMLGHRSGLANFTAPAIHFDDWKEQPQTPEQLLGFIRSQPPDFAAGAKADYNNSNFLLLGYILEKIYHRPYHLLLEKRLIHKLHLQHTSYGNHAGFQHNEAVSYKYFDNQWRPEKAVYVGNFGGAGAILSTPEDLCAFITAIFERKCISSSNLARMMRIEKDGYGWGLFPFGDSRHKGYGHNGKTEGFAASLQYYPESRLAIAYCANGEVYPKDKILSYVIKLCFGEPCNIPSFTPVTLKEPQLQRFTGIYADKNGLKVNAALTNGVLVLETKGQQFHLEALSELEFRNVRFGFFFNFDPDGRQLVIHDAGTTYWLRKE